MTPGGLYRRLLLRLKDLTVAGAKDQLSMRHPELASNIVFEAISSAFQVSKL
jgi:hypothetical protein